MTFLLVNRIGGIPSSIPQVQWGFHRNMIKRQQQIWEVRLTDFYQVVPPGSDVAWFIDPNEKYRHIYHRPRRLRVFGLPKNVFLKWALDHLDGKIIALNEDFQHFSRHFICETRDK